MPNLVPATEQIWLHKDRSLYKMLGQKKLSFWDLLSWSTITNYRKFKDAYGGNAKTGEGFVKGAVIVLGTKEQGILECYYEEFGKDFDTIKIEAAIKKIRGAKSQEAAASSSKDAAAKL